jgi:hypothetical protein
MGGTLNFFFAERVLLRAPEAVPLIHCQSCRTRYFDIALADAELARLYADYRGVSYFQQRNGYEPWYTRAMNDDLGGEIAMRDRRAVLHDALTEAGISNDFSAVLDHGGDRGQMLRDLKAPIKAVYEISGAAAEPGVVSVDEAVMKSGKWDLILSCHVLEHLPDPPSYVAELVSIGHNKTVYFLKSPMKLLKVLSLTAPRCRRAGLAGPQRCKRLLNCLIFSLPA